MADTQKNKSLLRRFSDQLWCWGKVLVVCRIPLVSAIGGGLVLNFSQAKDFFADLGLVWWQWTAFFLLLFGWAWIVHAGARRALQHDDWVIEAHVDGGLTPSQRHALQDQFRVPAEQVPRLLGLFVLLSVAWAMYSAGDNLLSADDLPEIRTAHGWTNVFFFITLVLAGLYAFLFWKRRDLQKHAAEKPEHGAQAEKAKFETQPAGLSKLLKQMPQPEGPLLIGTYVFPKNFCSKTSGSEGNRTVRKIDLVLLLIAAAITSVFVWAVGWPHSVAEIFPRPLIAPVLFGGSVLVLGEIAAWSHFKRTPFLLIMILVMVVVQFVGGRFHDVRWVKATPDAAQIELTAAIDRWKAFNRKGDTYPRPIIVAGAGGASRAGFMTASVVGAMIDYGIAHKSDDAPSVRNRIFAISAVSGSSVGAAVVRAALADAAQAGTPDTPPCKERSESAWFGSLAQGDDKAKFRPGKLWRDCFQQLLAGDFLSPVIVGLGYRDNFPLISALGLRMDDRAALLEQAFERRYSLITGGSGTACGEDDKTGLCRQIGYPLDAAAQKTWLPLLFLNASSGVTGRRILVSDVKSGSTYKDQDRTQTLLPFVFDITEMRGWSKKQCRSFVERLFQSIGIEWLAKQLGFAERDCTLSKDEEDNGLRLSTAATISARFPVISPYATIRDRTQNVVDRAVDGGYFENGGLATAADLVWALRAAGLDPVVVSVTNEPIVDAKPDRCPGDDINPQDTYCEIPGRRPFLPEYSYSEMFGGFTSILLALYQTREGHQEGSLGYLDSSMMGPNRHFPIGVRPLDNYFGPLCRNGDAPAKSTTETRPAVLKDVSMNWWVSQPVQAYLDGQLCVPKNTEKLVCELRSGGFGKPDCFP